jgi:hypothetical protein
MVSFGGVLRKINKYKNSINIQFSKAVLVLGCL